jgi:hypothetical protein
VATAGFFSGQFGCGLKWNYRSLHFASLRSG